MIDQVDELWSARRRPTRSKSLLQTKCNNDDGRPAEPGPERPPARETIANLNIELDPRTFPGTPRRNFDVHVPPARLGEIKSRRTEEAVARDLRQRLGSIGQLGSVVSTHLDDDVDIACRFARRRMLHEDANLDRPRTKRIWRREHG